MDKYLLDILSEYGIKEEQITDIAPFGNGHINSTFKVVVGNSVYILQKINHYVFKKPLKLMENMVAVTTFIKEKVEKFGGNADNATITVIKTLKGKNAVVTNRREYFRLQHCIDAVTVDSADNETLYTVGETFGKFQNLLSDFPAHTLYEVIPDFHNTVKRYNDLCEAISVDIKSRAEQVKPEIDYALSMKNYIGRITSGLATGELPLRVTHNDTKLNNVLLDKETLRGLCVIDLDTIMPGSYLYDYGDALRFAASTADEDEKDLSKVKLNMEKFKAFTLGYISQTKNKLTDNELELMAYSVELMTYECGIRFLTDYLCGDTYFKIDYEEHNLDRARAQFALARDIHEKLPEMQKIIYEYAK